MRITNPTFEGNLIVECTLDGVDVFYYDGKNHVRKLMKPFVRLNPVLGAIDSVADFAIEKYQEGYYDDAGKKRHSGKLHRSDIR